MEHPVYNKIIQICPFMNIYFINIKYDGKRSGVVYNISESRVMEIFGCTLNDIYNYIIQRSINL